MNYFYIDNFGNRKGPFDWNTLRSLVESGRIHTNTQIITPEGQTKTAAKIDGLFTPDHKPESVAEQIPTASGTVHDYIDAFKTVDYRKEIIPIDETNISVIVRDATFWVVLMLGIIPISIAAFNDLLIQLYGLLFFFAVIWGYILRGLVLRSHSSIILPIISFFFTGVVGVMVMMLMYEHCFPPFILQLSESQNMLVSLFGFVFQVGICEEVCKILPVLLYIAWKRKKSSPMKMLLIGIFSGLGFATFENVGYVANHLNVAVENIEQLIVGLVNAQNSEEFNQIAETGKTNAAMIALLATINGMLRSLSLVFAHAIWTGIFSYYLVCALSGDKRLVVFAALGLSVSAVLHGIYDWLCELEPGFAALVIGLSFILFFGYLTKIRRQLLKPTV